VVVDEELSLDDDGTLWAVVCARLRGAQKEKLLSRLKAEYREDTRKSPEYPELETGDLPKIFEEWITIDPPVRIP